MIELLISSILYEIKIEKVYRWIHGGEKCIKLISLGYILMINKKKT